MSTSQSTPRPGADLSRSARTRKTGAGGPSSYDLARWALRATAGRKNVTARGVLLGIVSHADKHLRCHPNRETLAAYHYGVAEDQVTKSQTNHVSVALTQLTEMGLISITKRKAKGGVSNEYTLLVPLREGEVVPGVVPLHEGEQAPPLGASLPLREGEPLPLREGGGNNQGTTIYNHQGTTRVDLKEVFKKKKVEDTTTHPPSGEAATSAARSCLPTPVGTLETSTIPELSRRQVMRAAQHGYLLGYVTRALVDDENHYGFPGEKPMPLSALADLLLRKRGDLAALWEKLPDDKRSEVLEFQ